MSKTPVDQVIDSGPVPIAIRDFGGSGPAVVLVHGLGASLASWAEFAPELTDRHRVVAVDLRGHGASGDGPWEWSAVVDDVAEVVRHLGLDNPAVVGNSLGGYVATYWGKRYPECPGLVSFDGHRSPLTGVENFPGLSPDLVTMGLANLDAMFSAQLDALPAGYRPDRGLLETLRPLIGGAGLFPVLPEIRCPLLMVLADRNVPGPEEFDELMDAYRRGLHRDLDAARAANPNIQVVEVDASHGMLSVQPKQLAELVGRFLSGAAVS